MATAREHTAYENGFNDGRMGVYNPIRLDGDILRYNGGHTAGETGSDFNPPEVTE